MTSRTLTEVLPADGARIRLDDPGARAWIEARYGRADAAYVRLNMITTLTGSAVGSDGTSESITNRADRAVLAVIRALADAVVVGAGSVRAERYVVPERGVLAIVTTTGALPGSAFTPADRERVALVCPTGAEDRVRAAAPGIRTIPVPGDARLAPAAIVRALAAHGLTRLVCEGGPSLASAFAEAGVLDELCVTCAPVLEPAAQPFLRLTTRAATTVAGMLVDDEGFSYLRLRVPGPAPLGASTA